jgi:hypothetical protein
VPNVPVAPRFELSPQPVVDLACVPSGFVPANMQTHYVKSSVADTGIRRVSAPPISVMISLVYVLAVVGTGLYFLFYFLLSA